MGNQRSSPSHLTPPPPLHQLCTPAPNENAAKVVVKFCYDFFLLPFAIRHSTFAAFSNTFRMCLSVAGRESGQGRGDEGRVRKQSTRRIRMQMSMTGKAGMGWGSFLSYFLLVFKVVKIDGPSAAVPPPLLWPPFHSAVLRALLT